MGFLDDVISDMSKEDMDAKNRKKVVLESWVRDDLDIVNMAKMVKR